MTVIIFFKDGCIHASKCNRFYLESGLFYIEKDENPLEEVKKILVDGIPVFEADK